MKTKTIDKIILASGYTKEQLDEYRVRDIINGCGGHGGYNIGELAKKLVTLFPKFNTEKHLKLIEDLKYICYLHDLAYILGDSYLDKLMADIDFCVRLARLLHWTTKTKRRTTVTAVFFGLTLKGNKYYYDEEKYKLRTLIIKI